MVLVRNTPSESWEGRENAGVYLCSCFVSGIIEGEAVVSIVVRYLLHKEQQIALVGVSMLDNAGQ